MTLAPDPLVRALADRYRLDREIGAGGMATVFLAVDLRHNRSVAVKVFRPELAQSLGTERFLREIQLAAQLHHPHIISLIDSGEVDGLLYYLMPFVEGETLRQCITRGGPLPVADAVRIAREVGDALRYAHKRGIVHRDIKPENILLADDHAYVVDFGIARALDSAAANLTQTGFALGTPAYMAPEQAMGDKAVDGRADLYALGCVLFEMLTGAPPYTGPTQQAILVKRFTEPVPAASARRREVPDWLDQLVTRALAREPDARPSATEVVAALTDAVKTPVPPRREPERSVVVLPFANQSPDSSDVFLGEGEREPSIAVVFANLGGDPENRPEVRLTPAGDIERTRSREPAPVFVNPVPQLSIVVLPFENSSPDPDNAYFADGLTDEVISDLSKVGALRVIARASSSRLKGTTKDLPTIGRELGVRYALSGSVRRAGDALRITAELVDATTNTTMWSDKYSGTIADVFDLQERLSRRIVEALSLTLSPAESRRLEHVPMDVRAFEYYLRAKREIVVFSGAALARAEQLLDAAIALTGESALLWATKAYAIAQRTNIGIGAGPEVLREAVACADRALTLDPSLAMGHFVRGFVTSREGDMQLAVRHLKHAHTLDPNLPEPLYWLGIIRMFVGRYDEARASLRQLTELDPLTPALAYTLGAWLDGMSGNWAAGVQGLRQWVAAEPSEMSYLMLGHWSELAGDQETAMGALDWLNEHHPDAAITPLTTFVRFAAIGDREAALGALTQDANDAAQVDESLPWFIGGGYARLGMVKEAVEWARIAVARGSISWPLYSTHHPWYARLRGEPEFAAFLAELKPVWEAFEP